MTDVGSLFKVFEFLLHNCCCRELCPSICLSVRLLHGDEINSDVKVSSLSRDVLRPVIDVLSLKASDLVNIHENKGTFW